jgi:hypothetical protein
VEKAMGANFKVGFGNAMAKKIVELRDGKIVRVKASYEDEDRVVLNKIKNGETSELKD